LRNNSAIAVVSLIGRPLAGWCVDWQALSGEWTLKTEAAALHANGLGELRGEWRSVFESTPVAVVRRCSRDVARLAAAADRDRLCFATPLFVLGRAVTTVEHCEVPTQKKTER
jgi:hypothetical protein